MKCVSPLVALLGFLSALSAAQEVGGVFKLEQRDGRSALVTPEGKTFVPLGINHLGVALAADANGKKLSTDERAQRLAQMERDLRNWGFNTVGYGAVKEMWSRFPFIAEVSLTRCGHYLPRDRFAYDDVFDPSFHAQVRAKVAALCATTRDNPNCIGYWWTDTPRWDLEIAQRFFGTNWVSTIRALPEAAPGRKRYAEFLRGPGPHDDRAFLRLIARELYAVTAAAFKEHDPKRLLFGERYKLGDHPPEVLAEAAKFVDVLSIQPGPEAGPLPGPGREEREFDATRFDALHRVTGKPIAICDHQVSFRDPAHPVTLWHQFATQAEAADSYERFLRAAFARPYIVGYFRCQYWNQWMPAPRALLKQGLRQTDGQPYAEIVKHVTDINADVLKELLPGVR
jgi:hypothetical protein